MKRNKFKLICILSFIGVIGISLAAVPLSSFLGYSNGSVSKPGEGSGSGAGSSGSSAPVEERKILQSIDAKLKEGVEFFNNGLAAIKNTDLIVTATYKQGQNTFEEEVESDKFQVTSPSDFTLNGGTVAISYLGKTTTIDVTLTEVKAVSIEVSKEPYKKNYQKDQTFNARGMEITVHYNDGSTKVLKEGDYSYDSETPLTLERNKVTITYNDGSKNLTVDVAIHVFEHLEKGSLVSLLKEGDAFVEAGAKINTAALTVLGVYESGDVEPLETDSYTIQAADENAIFGKKYTVTVKYNETIKMDVPVTIRNHVEGENATIVGGSIVEEAEYVYENKTFTKVVDKLKTAGGFGGSVNSGKDAYISFDLDSILDVTTDITMRCANSYLVKDSSNYYMRPLQINTIADLLINGEKVNIPDDVVLKGCGPSESYAPLYNVYYEFTFKDIMLSAGTNEIKLSFKPSTEGALNYWNESPSTMNIDFINVDSTGKNLPSDLSFTQISFSRVPELKFGTKLEDYAFSIVGELEDGTKVGLTKDQYDASIEGYSGTYLPMGEKTLKVTYKANPTLTVKKTVTIDSLKIEAENCTLSGSTNVKVTNDDSYTFEDGAYKNSGKVSAVVGMDNSTTKYAGETSITMKFTAAPGTYVFSSRLSNAYFFDSPTKHALEVVLKDVIKLKVNGTYIDLGDVSLPVINDATQDDYIWKQFFERTLANVTLIDGENTIVVEGNRESTLKNRYNEIPVPRFDWFMISPLA